MFSIIETGGKQYKVKVGDSVKIEKLEFQAGDKVVFDKVLLVSESDEDANIGRPYLANAKVTGEVIRQDRAKKVIFFRYKAKKRERRKGGHRQPFTEVKITNIESN